MAELLRLFSVDMMRSTLDRYLERPPCESCQVGRMRPVDVMGGQSIFFRCSNARCFNNTSVELPEIEKKVIYLDTSTVSHMARAKARGEADAPYLKLYEALRRASARNLVVCPGSTIVEEEAEFSNLANTIIEMSRHLSDPGLHHHLQVKEAQLFRSLERWLAAAPPQLELNLPWRDAFEDDVHVWHGTFNIFMNTRTPEDWVEAAKCTKGESLAKIEEMYRAYEADGYTFEQMVAVEERGFAESVIINGPAMIAARVAYTQGQTSDANMWWSSTFDKIAHAIEHVLRCEKGEAHGKATDFLRSQHAVAIPFAYVSGRLYAALAMLCRGKAPRLPKPGDSHDIEHMATFMPYVDVFIADNAMASLTNQNHLRLGEPFQTKIHALGVNDVPDFIDWLESLADGNDVAALSERISQSIWQGGFNQDFIAHMRATMPEAFRDTSE